jgi:hypothetical protein
MRALVWLIFVSSVCFAQELKVRVINGKDGQPLPKQAVTVQFVNETPVTASSPLRLETDANGEVRFGIPKPLPEHLHVRVALTSEYWHCGCCALRKGAKANDVPARTEPGEILIIARPFTFGERLLYPLVKQ